MLVSCARGAVHHACARHASRASLSALVTAHSAAAVAVASSTAASSVLPSPCRRSVVTSASRQNVNPLPPPPSSTPQQPSSQPPPMELPSFLLTWLHRLRRRAAATPNLQAGALYMLTLRNPLARPTSSKAAKDLPPLTVSRGLLSLNLPDDELTRFRLVGLHIWMLQKMLLTGLAGREAQEAFIGFQAPANAALPTPSARQRKIVEYVFEHFWADLTPFLKDARGEMKLTKTLLSVQQYFYGAFVTLDMAWLNQMPELAPPPVDKNDAAAVAAAAATAARNAAAAPLIDNERESLAAALWRNYYMSDPQASKRDVYRMIYYMQRQMHHLATLPAGIDLWDIDAAGNGRAEEVQWLACEEIFDPARSIASMDREVADALGITTKAWSNPSFDGWEKHVLSGQTFDTRFKEGRK